MRLRTVEPEGFDDTARSLAAGEICRNTGPEAGLCDAIVTPAPGQLTFPILNRLAGAGIVVSDDEVRAAMRAAYAHLKLVVEPAARWLWPPHSFMGLRWRATRPSSPCQGVMLILISSPIFYAAEVVIPRPLLMKIKRDATISRLDTKKAAPGR